MSKQDIERYYALLNLNPGAPVDEIEAAYLRAAFKKRRQGRTEELEQLKAAYNALREHTYAQGLTNAQSQPTQEIVELLNEQLQGQGIVIKASWQGDELRIALDASRTRDPKVATALIYTTLSELKRPELQKVRIRGLRGSKSIVWERRFSLLPVEAPATPSREQATDFRRFDFNSPIAKALALPVAFFVAFFLNTVLQLQPLLWIATNLIHEFGHATVAWFSGRRALPLLGWTSVNPQRSLFVYFGILCLLGLLFRAGWREKLPGTMGLAVGIALLQFYLTWFTDPYTFEMLLTFGGIGGEFYLSSLLIGGFYLRLPDRWRWDFWRFIALAVAANTFWNSFWQWHRITQGVESIPWGSFFGGRGDSGGDMNRLSWEFGWSNQQIIDIYTQLGNLCAIALFGIYLYFLFIDHPHLWQTLQQKGFDWQQRLIVFFNSNRREL